MNSDVSRSPALTPGSVSDKISAVTCDGRNSFKLRPGAERMIMQKIKKITAYMLAAALAFSLAACGGSSPAAQTPAPPNASAQTAKAQPQEDLVPAPLSAGSYLADESDKRSRTPAELYLFGGGCGLMVMGNVMYGASWSEDSLEIEGRSVAFSCEKDRAESAAHHDPVLSFSFNGAGLRLRYDSEINGAELGMRDQFNGEYVGRYLGEDGTEAVFNEDGSALLTAGSEETPFFWGTYYLADAFCVTGSYLSGLERTDSGIRFSTDESNVYELESEAEVQRRAEEAREAEKKEREKVLTAHYYPYGNAARLSGRIVIFSIFPSGPDYSWDLAAESDQKLRDKCLKDLSSAVSFLEQKCAGYGSEVEFLYDWDEDPGLAAVCESEYPVALKDEQAEKKSHAPLARSLADTPELKEKYQADSVIYLYFVNSDYSNTTNPHAHSFDARDIIAGNLMINDLVEYAVINLKYHQVQDENGSRVEEADFTAGDIVIAHEMLHLFGAPDLYAGGEQGISREYADHLLDIKSKDIMLAGYAGASKLSQFTLSEISAYYLGLADHCGDVEKYGLRVSQYESLKKN